MRHDIRWTARKIKQRIDLIRPLVYRRKQPIEPLNWMALDGPLANAPVGRDVDDSLWPVIFPGTNWGNWRQDFVLRSGFRIPDSWPVEVPVVLQLPLGEAGDFSHPEALVYVDGLPYAAVDRHHPEVLLPDEWRDGKSHQLALHGWTGLGSPDLTVVNNGSNKLVMKEPMLAQVDLFTRGFAALAQVALDTATSLDPDHPAHSRLLNALNDAFNYLDTRAPLGEGFYDSVELAYSVLREGIDAAGSPLDVDLIATGHAHLDIAWLWTVGQARRKAERTFSNVIRLMEQFPEYHFTQSQPQLYAFLERDSPTLFQQIRERVEEGRWEPIGGMWVEADCNISGAESLARQLLLGRTYFRETFGPEAETPVLWLPDVFGYAWNLPQLIRQAGLEYFMTIKIGWSQYNRLPYDTFWWQGLDGSQVLTHFSTVQEPGSPWASTYNAMATPQVALSAWQNFQQKEAHATLLMAYGFGDGGGGPTREMLDTIRKMEALPGLPRVRQGSVREFFETLEAEIDPTLPVWNGELYLEYHRGTYTTQARTKRANRKAEFLLHDAEFLAALASLLNDDYKYPGDAFREAWQTVCLNQFHDILPGSSIGEVYKESLADYQRVQARVEDLRSKALTAIAMQSDGDLLLINPTSFARADLAFWPGDLPAGVFIERSDREPVYGQRVEGGLLLDTGLVLPPYSVTPLWFGGGDLRPPASDLVVRPDLLENQFLRVEFNENGAITRIFDKQAYREVLPEGAVANEFQLFEDRPLNWDAWDLDIYYDDRMWTPDPATSITVVEDGPLRSALEIRRPVGNSEIVQKVMLAYNSDRLDFETRVDWHERHTLLKVAFPVDVLAPQATYEIQWGNVERPTHRNTSWDWARFETCAHKWVDLSEGDYGVSLLNDCKYGHDIQGNVIRLTLLRSPTMPDPEADQGEHLFTYSLLPHAGNWRERTIPAAYHFNDPLLALDTHSREGGLPGGQQPLTLVESDSPNVVIETIKRAEDGNGIIVRLYEAHRQRGPVTLRTHFPLEGAWLTNLLEENVEALQVETGICVLNVTPYQIITLRLVPSDADGPPVILLPPPNEQ